MDELQLHDLQNIEAVGGISRRGGVADVRGIPAVDVQKNARPATADDAIVPNTPARGKEIRAPIPAGYGP